MEAVWLALLLAGAVWTWRARDRHQRVLALAQCLAPHQIEKHMETLTQGYLRALDERDAERQGQIWALLQTTEQSLCAQVRRLAEDFAQTAPDLARVSTLPVRIPGATQVLAAHSFDMREALALHARGICRAANADSAQPARDRAYRLMAEMLLFQHSCHWYCNSRLVASARMRARHQTDYAQLVAGVDPATREAYERLVGRA